MERQLCTTAGDLHCNEIGGPVLRIATESAVEPELSTAMLERAGL